MLGVGQALGVIAIDELDGTMEVYIVDDTNEVGISMVNELIEESELKEVDELDKMSVVEDDSRYEEVVGVEKVDSIELICDELRAVEEDDIVDAGSIAEKIDGYVELLVIIGELVLDDESDNIAEAEDVGSTVDSCAEGLCQVDMVFLLLSHRGQTPWRRIAGTLERIDIFCYPEDLAGYHVF
jgi:hypothetical protein